MRGRGPLTFPWCPKEFAPRKGWDPFFPPGLRHFFGPRCVAKLVRSTTATTCAWLLAIFRKLAETWHT